MSENSDPDLGDEPQPAKPVTDPLPSDEELEAEDEPGQEEVPDEEVMAPSEADADDTVDDKEDDPGPSGTTFQPSE